MQVGLSGCVNRGRDDGPSLMKWVLVGMAVVKTVEEFGFCPHGWIGLGEKCFTLGRKNMVDATVSAEECEAYNGTNAVMEKEEYVSKRRGGDVRWGEGMLDKLWCCFFFVVGSVVCGVEGVGVLEDE